MHIVEWVQQYYGISDNTKELFESANAFSFLFVWAIFEGEICNGYAKLKDIEEIQHNFDNHKTTTSFPFFQKGTQKIEKSSITYKSLQK